MAPSTSRFPEERMPLLPEGLSLRRGDSPLLHNVQAERAPEDEHDEVSDSWLSHLCEPPCLARQPSQSGCFWYGIALGILLLGVLSLMLMWLTMMIRYDMEAQKRGPGEIWPTDLPPLAPPDFSGMQFLQAAGRVIT